MNIPEYVKDAMGRAEFVIGKGDPGYTIRIHKKTDYTTAETMKKEAERIVAWANRAAPTGFDDVPTARLDMCPTRTHYFDQTATVTIYDPVMRALEQYIKEARE